MTAEALTPSHSLLCKLASVAVHADEFISEHRHPLDLDALKSSLNDPEVEKWLAQMTAMAMAPKKRHEDG